MLVKTLWALGFRAAWTVQPAGRGGPVVRMVAHTMSREVLAPEVAEKFDWAARVFWLRGSIHPIGVGAAREVCEEVLRLPLRAARLSTALERKEALDQHFELNPLLIRADGYWRTESGVAMKAEAARAHAKRQWQRRMGIL